MVEFAVMAPIMVFLMFGVFQLGMMGYASVVARYAAFYGVRMASIQDSGERDRVAREEAVKIVSAAPLVRLEGVATSDVAAISGDNGDTTRLSMIVRLRVPQLLPGVSSTVEGLCVAPMEAVDWEYKF